VTSLPPTTATPLRDRLFASIHTWTADLSRETRTLLPLTLRALRLIVVLTVLFGVIFPLILFGIGQAAFPSQANGSLITDRQGHIIGSSLIGQQFTDPAYFHGRPSVVGYDASSSGESAMGPTNPQLLSGNGSDVTVAPGATPPPGSTPVPGKPNNYHMPGSYLGVTAYAERFRRENGLPPNTRLPADIVTASGSGLDPDISVAAAELQVNWIVAVRRSLGGRNATMTAAAVRVPIAQVTEGRQLGFLGEPRVNVLALNLALDAAYGAPPAAQAATGSR
jgi:K+-transporting ATPase ATPase C chain